MQMFGDFFQYESAWFDLQEDFTRNKLLAKRVSRITTTFF